MFTLVVYFKEDELELWSLDQSSRLISITPKEEKINSLPLYLYADETDIQYGTYPMELFHQKRRNSFGNFWTEITQSEVTINYFGNSLPIKQSLAYFLKRTIDDVHKSHSLDSVVWCFEPFVAEKIREEQLQFFKSVIPNVNHVSIPFYEVFSEYRKQKDADLNISSGYVNLRSHFGDLHLNFVKNGRIADFEKLEKMGADPRLTAILGYIVPQIKAQGCYLEEEEIRQIVIKDAQDILLKLPNGLVDHQFNNPRLGINWYMSVHKNVFIQAIENGGTEFFVSQAIKNFVDRANAQNSVKFISTPALNVKQFYDSLGMSHLVLEESDFNQDFILYMLRNIGSLQRFNDINDKSEKATVSNTVEREKVQEVKVGSNTEEPPKIEESADPDKVLDEAEVLMKDAKWESAVLKLEHFLKLSPNDRYGTKKLDEAKKNFEHLENINSLYDQGDKLMASKSYGAAIDIWELILKVKPGDRYGKGELQSAKELFDKQKNENPNGGPKAPPAPPQRPSTPPKSVAKKAASKTPPKRPAPPKAQPKPAVKAQPKPSGLPIPPPPPPRPSKPATNKAVSKPPGPPKPPPPPPRPPKPPSPKGKSGPPALPKPPPLKK